ncbi:hypothetical protein HJC23_011326 [Cyclotella cryptica]|uniref:SSD domain-containing protein n=1 Tax=Cyclotella cryptica TaxID=29204 RepID=A0ABD3QW21_9STRA
MIADQSPTQTRQSTCLERAGDSIDRSIHGFFYRVGRFCCNRPKTTIGIALAISIICAAGMAKLTPENRPEKLWVPQGTQAGIEEEQFFEYFPANSRFQNVIISSSKNDGSSNVLTKDKLVNTMKLHESIESGVSSYNGTSYTFSDLCTVAGGSCVSYDVNNPICNCLVISVLKMWNYDLATLEADEDILSTLTNYGTKEDLSGVLGNPSFDSSGKLVSAEAISISYFLADRSIVEDGSETDPINEEWEKTVFLESVQGAEQEYTNIYPTYLSSRSFADEFGGEIQGDLVYVQVSYVVAFIFVGATMGSRLCGRGSRWAMAFSALVLVAMSTVAGFGVASLAGLIYGPVHSVLPFVLLGIGVDDAFVIANAFDREREGVPREKEDDESLVKRGARALARSGASITVTSLTDLVAFAISASSALPALGSFCAFASINIFFLWALSATFFTSTMLLDEKRQRDNRRDMLCCLKRKTISDEEDNGSKEGFISRYFRYYHGPAILSKAGKPVTLLVFAGLLGFGIYGTMELPVEDSSRSFIPSDSYVNDYAAAADNYFPSSGTSLYITFENGEDIYASRTSLSALDSRVSGLSDKSPYIAEPDSVTTYQNVMAGMKNYLSTYGTAAIGNVTLGEDGWPTNYVDFVASLSAYASIFGPGAPYAQDVSFSSGQTNLEALRVKLEYVRLTKLRRGEVIDDADRQIESMDATREMVESWTDLPPAFPYCVKFIDIEGFKIINTELYRNVGLAILAVGVICLITVANVITALLITINVAACIVEILGFMYALGLVIDSVSVINLVLAVGLSVDYSAHIGHCFMVKGGYSKDNRVIEALADIGASVLNGALSTFLAVAVLLFSTSYVFRVLSIQFALTVGLGVLHGIVLLPVLLSILGPRPFSSAEEPKNKDSELVKREVMDKTAHAESFGLDALEEFEDLEEYEA